MRMNSKTDANSAPGSVWSRVNIPAAGAICCWALASGDRYLRTLLIHGARAAIRVVERRRDPRSLALSRLKARRGSNVAAVALANHNARVLWALLTKGEDYRPRAAQMAESGVEENRNDFLPEVAKAVSKMMANRSDRRLPSLFMTETHEVAYLMRRRRADSIRARAIFKAQSKGRIYVSNRILHSPANSFAPRLGPYKS